MIPWCTEFPECSVKNPRETGYDSDIPYLCCLVDKRFPQRAEFRALYAYREVTDEGEDFFSWSDGSNVYSHVCNGHDDHLRVIKWCKYTDTPEHIRELLEFDL